MKLGDIVYYIGEYNNCHNYKYEIVTIYKNGFGVDWWYDLKVVEPNIKTHFTEILSVEKLDIKLDIKEEVEKSAYNNWFDHQRYS